MTYETKFERFSTLLKLKSITENKTMDELFQEECANLKTKIKFAVHNKLDELPSRAKLWMSRCILSGGSISSIYHNEIVHDYDFWAKDAVLIGRISEAVLEDAEQVVVTDEDAKYGEWFGDMKEKGFVQTPNAITLKNRVQFITLSNYEDARKNFDLIHCLPHYDIVDQKLYISREQWLAIKNKELIGGYKEPSESRLRKYRERGWK